MNRIYRETKNFEATTKPKPANKFSRNIVSISIFMRLRLLLLGIGLAATGCSVPNLETPQCAGGREVVKRFYSYHFGNEISGSPDNQKGRERFLSNDLINELSTLSDRKMDYFTATDDPPKAFRVGECTAESDTKVAMQVVLLWRDDTRTAQKEVKVDAVRSDGKWLLNKVSN